MPKNKLSDLTDHLFAAIERLSDETLTDERIAEECKRAEAVVSVADQIVRTADLQLKAAVVFSQHGERVLPMLPMIGRSDG